MSTKYQLLEHYLMSLPVSCINITLSFKDIERLIGCDLPSSAYQHRAWWSNQADLSTRPQAKAWRNAGFKVGTVKSSNIDGMVSFSREGKFPIDDLSVLGSHANRVTRPQLPSTEKRTDADRAPGHQIVLLSCVKSKRNYPCRAGEIYASPLFQKMMAYARRLNPERIFILSAEYGLLNPDDVINPYERTLKNMKADEKQRWAQDVLSKLKRSCNIETDNFIFLAGVPYRENLVSHLRHYDVPMEGLAFGRQLQWLDRQLR